MGGGAGVSLREWEGLQCHAAPAVAEAKKQKYGGAKPQAGGALSNARVSIAIVSDS